MPLQGNAFVARSADVDPVAQVAGNARVLHHAVVRGNTRVLDDAVVGHHARLLAGPGPQGAIYVHGSAVVDGHAVVGAGADIAHRRHLLTITGLGPDTHTLTAWRGHPVRLEDGEWRWGVRVHLSGWYGDLTALDERIEHGDLDWPICMERELDVALDLVTERLGDWQVDPVENVDRRRWQLRDSDLRRHSKRAEADAKRAAGIPLDQPRPKVTR